jgi:hypothetical protein
LGTFFIKEKGTKHIFSTNHPGKAENIQLNTNHPGKPPNKQPSTKQIKKNYICTNETIKLPLFKIEPNTPLVHPHLRRGAMRHGLCFGRGDTL